VNVGESVNSSVAQWKNYEKINEKTKDPGFAPQPCPDSLFLKSIKKFQPFFLAAPWRSTSCLP
jgi:hypothetical protein